MNEIYRFRNLEKAYDEVRHAYFYAHSSRYQNDAREGALNIFFKTTPETWESLFKHHFQSVYKALSVQFVKRQVVICGGKTWEDDFGTKEDFGLFEGKWAEYRDKLQIGVLSQCLSESTHPIDQTFLSHILERLEGHAEMYLPFHRPELDVMQLGPTLLSNKLIDLVKNYQGKVHPIIGGEYSSLGVIANMFDDPNLDPNLRWLTLDFTEAWLRNLIALSIPDVFTSSFCEKYDNPVLWGHYADFNHGVCLIYSGDLCGDTFSIPGNGEEKISIQKIKYEKETLSFDFFSNLACNRSKWHLPAIDNFDAGHQILISAIGRKHPSWKDENEWRLVVTANEIANDQKVYYRESALKGVIFGCRTPTRDISHFLSLLKDLSTRTQRSAKYKLYKASHDTESGLITRFEMEWPGS